MEDNDIVTYANSKVNIKGRSGVYEVVSWYEGGKGLEFELRDLSTGDVLSEWISILYIDFLNNKGEPLPELASFDTLKKGAYIELYVKTNDLASSVLFNKDGTRITSSEGSIPSFIPSSNGIEAVLEIDLSTGKIKNWNNVTKKELIDFYTRKD